MKFHAPLLAAGLLVGLAAPALAFHCPADMARIDAALPDSSLDGDQMSKVKQLRADGQTQHEAGEHQAAVDSLAEAMAMLNIQ